MVCGKMNLCNGMGRLIIAVSLKHRRRPVIARCIMFQAAAGPGWRRLRIYLFLKIRPTWGAGCLTLVHSIIILLRGPVIMFMKAGITGNSEEDIAETI